MSKNAKSKRNIIKGKDAVQPSTSGDRITISKTNRGLENRKED
ncbi:hypothetical protein JOD43_001015 [Pullulanibacillus pueri]|uniref:Uncharacterized protein n=1 Tax=Pullulanibacillus pueri TaxID=1437324 RepID=A0A8J3ELA1_9BACL|nr:hypothetical protein [Pullulanibacillus pueri]MBM7680851.1 hypothetical protein [Pullulanibacillus pueri]GGH78571.1 hypothetical protein GCM10007096_12210 [Pullulanibacillus pueri]